MKTAVGLIYYNDVKSLQRLMPTIVGHFDDIIAIDGRFSMIEGREDYSSDGSTEYLKTIDNVILKKFVGSEPEKRNIYIETARKLGTDILFIIDADEYVIEAKGWDVFEDEMEKMHKSDFPLWGIRHIHHGKKTTSYARFFKRLESMKYSKSHCVLDINGHLITIACDPKHFLIAGIRIQSDDFLRSPVWDKEVTEYQEKLRLQELEIRAKAQLLVFEGAHRFINIQDVYPK